MKNSQDPVEHGAPWVGTREAEGEAGGGSNMDKPEKAKGKRRRLKVAHPERCIGCLSCMFACSRINADRASPDRSAIKVKTQGGLEGDFAVVVCRACKDPPCARACPTGALVRKEGGGVLLNKELCQGCGACSDACLIRAISQDDEGQTVCCKHCGACVAFCPHGVLEMEEVEG